MNPLKVCKNFLAIKLHLLGTNKNRNFYFFQYVMTIYQLQKFKEFGF